MKQKYQMCLVKVIIDYKYKDSLLNYLSGLNLVHIKSMKHTKLEEKIIEENPIVIKLKKLRDNLNTFFNKINISEYSFQDLKLDPKLKLEFNVNDLNELVNHIMEELDFYTFRYKELERNISHAKIELENITVIKKSYTFLHQFDLNRESMTIFNQLDFKVFTTYKKNIESLTNIFNFSELPNIYQTSSISEDSIVFYIIYPRDRSEELKKRINIIHANEVPILKKYLTNQGINFNRISKEIEVIEYTLSKYEKELKRIRDENLYKFAAFHEVFNNLEEYLWAEHQFEVLPSGNLKFNFYIPLKKKEYIKKELFSKFKDKVIVDSINITKQSILLESKKEDELDSNKHLKYKKDGENGQNNEATKDEDANIIKDTPTLTKKHLFFIRPFETLTKMYGTPAYSEIDPTPFLAITFPLLFGLMFGDIGHGLCLILAGLIGAIIFKKSKGVNFYNFCWIIFYCGWGSVLGGFLYGEFFGDTPNQIFTWHLVPFLQDPMENVMYIFKFVILIGVIHLTLGWIIQMFNYIKQKRKYMAFSDSFIKILLLTGGTYLIFVWGFDITAWTSLPFPILLPLIPGLLLITLKPLGKVLGVSYMKKESYGSLMGEGSLEAFETLLSIMSNVASYIRLLALALAHIALMIAIQAMVDIIPAGGLLEIIRIGGLIFGNMIVIVLEGLLVFINNVRLHFYEFFFKFYQGSGIEFSPFNLNNLYSSIKFNIEEDIVLEEIEKEIVSKIDKNGVREARKYISKKYL